MYPIFFVNDVMELVGASLYGSHFMSVLYMYHIVIATEEVDLSLLI